MYKKNLTIIIVTYNVKSLLEELLESIHKSNDKLNKEIFVVDNGNDDTYKLFQNSKKYIYIKNKDNLGFSKANNIAYRRAKGKYILILNPDTRVQKDTIDKMYSFMENNKDIVISTCKLLLPSGDLDPSCKRNFPTIKNSMGKIFHLSKISSKFDGYNISVGEDTQMDIDACSGAFMFIRKDKVEDKKSLFDESFWAMGEDLDLCLRIKESGGRIVYYPETSVLHYKGASGGIKDTSQKYTKADINVKKRWIRAYRDAMKIFYSKHYKKNHNFITNILVNLGIEVDYIIKIIKLRFL